MAVWSERARHRQLLTKEQKRSNRELNRFRVVVEHVNRLCIYGLKNDKNTWFSRIS